MRSYPIELGDVRRPLEHLRGHHKLYYLVYRLMLESGARFEHVLRVKTYTALPHRHVDPRREETYHHRPAGIY